MEETQQAAIAAGKARRMSERFQRKLFPQIIPLAEAAVREPA